MNPVTTGEHVSVIERHICQLKEGFRGMYLILSFYKKRKIPVHILIAVAHVKTFQEFLPSP